MRSVYACFALLAILAVSATAETYVIAPNGSGDFATIQDALDAAVTGDIIELMSGTFLGGGNRDLVFHGKGITVRSQSGSAETCIIDCDGSEAEPHRGVDFSYGEGAGTRLEAITITGGWADYKGGAVSCDGAVTPTISDCHFLGNHAQQAGGIECYGGAAPTIENCYFEGNEAEWSGGALQAYGAAPIVVGCTFYANHANHGAGMYVYGGGASPEVMDCLFLENEEAHSTGGLHAEHFASPTLRECIFVGNSSLSSGAALTASIVVTAEVYNCTFWGNGEGSQAPTVANGEDCQTTLQNTIIAATHVGPALVSYPGGSAFALLTCCDLHGNAGGDWVGEIADQFGIDGNISADPLFCNPEMGEFTLAEDSPCAPFTPPNEECDLIGARPIGCGPTDVSKVSWGELKSRFR